MSQATPTTLAARVESLGEADLLPFHELLDAAMVAEALKAEEVRFNDCIYAPIVTLCLFLSQVIDSDHSCRASVARLIAWRVFRGLPPCGEETGTYCDARRPACPRPSSAGWSTRRPAGARSRRPNPGSGTVGESTSSTARRSRCRTRRRTRRPSLRGEQEGQILCRRAVF